ncbi:MAG: hypothetical protein RL540_1467 [Actinomycetota bacterium]|jgi:hypothetical protein
MVFKHGEGNEKLLTCSNCSTSMELDAVFCGECGARRTQALAESVLNPTSNPTEVSTKASSNPETATIFAEEIEKKPKRIREPRIRMAISRGFDATVRVIRKRAKFVYSVSSLILVLGIYGIAQTLIFSQNSPKDFAADYIKAVAAREVDKISSNSDLFPNPENLPILPQNFQLWDEVDGLAWKAFSEWNGWTGRGIIDFVPMDGNKIKDDQGFLLEIKASYKSKFGIFREITWQAANPIGSISLAMKPEKNVGFLVNDVPAGSSDAPLLGESKYAVLPGPIKASLVGAGFTKTRQQDIFIGSSGANEVKFSNIEYELNQSQISSAVNQLEQILTSCLKRKCSDLPRLSQFDFDFSNQPTDYLYTDYFITSWSDSPDCTVSTKSATSADDGYISLNCSVSASASIKWMLYRIWLTYYYSTGFDTESFNLSVSADVSRTSNPYSVKITNVNISS